MCYISLAQLVIDAGEIEVLATAEPSTNKEPTNKESIVLVHNKKKGHWQRAVSKNERGGFDMRTTRSASKHQHNV